ncbi:uncharacterized protein CTRU02_205284 [Colletotrichum truncatum]|uniref:Uncharacterized protein n=1 Tax=Colletotrichum truncatum TaxID=5467 RepID=A0ACC3Z3L4_COLTU|nr:uncharacterized protein CTRU02_04340 [Colletotrichum truncatum]KAF6795530.1 hypothetical protein CTRU02_04340 [Colletotrichum truncatum]
MATSITHQPSRLGDVDGNATGRVSCHPLMTLPLELRLLIWERFGAESRVFEYKEDTGLVRLALEYRHPRHVGLSICSESRKAIQGLLKPFEHNHELDKRSRIPPPLKYIPSIDIFYLPPLVYRSRIQAWDTIWTTKPGILNVGVHWSVLSDERRIKEALKALRRCFTDMRTLSVFVDFKALPEPEENVCKGGIVRIIGPVENDFRLPSLFAEAHGFLDDYWTWGELSGAIEEVRKRMKETADVEGLLYCREMEDGPDF